MSAAGALLVLWAGLGGLAGLLLSCLADLLPHGPTAARRCPRCGHPRTWQEFACNLRACPQCGYRARRPWAMLFLTAGLTVFLQIHPTKVAFPWLWPLTLLFLLVAVVDLEHRLVLSEVLAAGLLLGVALGVARRGWAPTLLGLAAGTLAMLALYALGRLLQRPLGAAEEPLGFGDVLVAALMGAVLGWPGVLVGLVWGIVLAGAFGLLLVLVMALWKRRWAGGVYLPYAPFLLLATWSLLL